MKKSYMKLWILSFVAIILASVTFYQVVTAFFSESKMSSSYQRAEEFIEGQTGVTLYKNPKDAFDVPIPVEDTGHIFATTNHNGKQIKFIWVEFHNNISAKEYYNEFNQRYKGQDIVTDLERTFFDEYSYRTIQLTGAKAFCYQNKKWVVIVEGTDEKDVDEFWSLFQKTM